MRIIVCGGKEFDDYNTIRKELDRLTAKLDKVILLMRSTKGMDALVKEWGSSRMIDMMEIHHLDVERHGRKALQIRNEEMVNNAQALIHFNNGKTSLDLKDLLDRAKSKGLKIKTIIV